MAKQRKPVKKKEEVKEETQVVAPTSFKNSITIELDDSEMSVIQTYMNLWNDTRATVEGYQPINEGQFLLYASLKWCENEERLLNENNDGLELGAEDDAIPAIQIHPPDLIDDAEFINIFAETREHS